MLLSSGIPVMRYNQAWPSCNNFVLSRELFSFQGFYFSASKVPETATKHSLATIYSNNHSTEFEDYELMTGGTIQFYIVHKTHTQMGLMITFESTNELWKLNVLAF
jgi:hypothetical protein